MAMNLFLCVDCAVVYDVEPHVERICPRCERPLGLQHEEPDKAATIAEVAGWAMLGQQSELRGRRWRVG